MNGQKFTLISRMSRIDEDPHPQRHFKVRTRL